MNDTLLFDNQRISSRKTVEKLRYDFLVKAFGSITPNIKFAPVQTILRKMRTLPNTFYSEWRRAMAEELLLLTSTGRKIPETWISAFKNTSPFGNNILLGECIKQPCACGVFPFTGKEQPGAGHIWILKNSKVKSKTNGKYKIIPGSYRLIFIPDKKDLHGESWQLAARMAWRCIIEKNKPAAETLAREWIMTGQSTHGNISPVNLGNKLQLPVKRKWIIPLDNIKDVPPSASNMTIRSAADENTAWSHITGQGFQTDSELPWPSNAGTLHILTGGNIKAAIVSALFLPRNSYIHLWYSLSSKPSASATRTILRELRPDLQIENPTPVSSNNLAVAEREIRSAVRNFNKTIIFNVTSGNLLMRLAVDAVARRYPNIILVYRDIDAKPYVFTRIDYQQFPHAVGTYRGDKLKLTGLNSNFLFGSAPYATGAATHIARDFLRQCRKK